MRRGVLSLLQVRSKRTCQPLFGLVFYLRLEVAVVLFNRRCNAVIFVHIEAHSTRTVHVVTENLSTSVQNESETSSHILEWRFQHTFSGSSMLSLALGILFTSFQWLPHITLEKYLGGV